MSAKTSAQPGRRTPLSLTAGSKPQPQQQKEQPQQSQKASSGSNEIQNNSKNDNKAVSLTQKTEKTPSETKESMQKDKKQQNVEKKSQPTSKIPTASLAGPAKKPEKNEEKKTQNGVGNSNGNAKEKQANGKDAKINVKENKEKTEILDKSKSDKVDNDKTEKVEKEKSSKSEKIEKLTENTDKKLTKAEERKKQKDSKLTGIDKDKGKGAELEEKKQPEKEVQSKRGSLENSEKKIQENQQDVEVMEVIFGENKSASSTTEPKTATPIKSFEKSPSNKSTPSKTTKSHAVVASPGKSTNTIDDVEMEALCVTPTKLEKPVKESVVAIQPTATSTPGKQLRYKELSSLQPSTGKNLDPQIKASLPDRNTCPRTFNQISGRRSIRAGNDYTTSYFQKNTQYRESYRKINTELDVTSNTNTSLNVTVGSEVPNNSSFSFFGRGRKRERTPPFTQSTMDLQNDLETSPKSPKRARIDMYGFFTAVASPLSLLRARFSKASIQSSTPVKLHLKLAEAGEDDVEVQNVSGISIEEEIPNNEAVADEITATEDVAAENANEGTPKKNSTSASDIKDESDTAEKEEASYEKCGIEKPVEGIDIDSDDIKVTETLTVGDPLSKNKRCNVM